MPSGKCDTIQSRGFEYEQKVFDTVSDDGNISNNHIVIQDQV